MSRNPLFARVDVEQSATGLWSARVNFDHGLPEPTRVFHRLGYLSRSAARVAGYELAHALGRSVVASVLALGIVANVSAMFASGARAADAAPSGAGRPIAVFEIDGNAWQCATADHCADMLARFGCRLFMRSGAVALVECEESTYRRQLARHSA